MSQNLKITEMRSTAVGKWLDQIPPKMWLMRFESAAHKKNNLDISKKQVIHMSLISVSVEDQMNAIFFICSKLSAWIS